MEEKFFPSAPLGVILPEEIGFIDNVRAIVKLIDKEISIRCGHILSYHASSSQVWIELFDEYLNPLQFSNIISDDNKSNSSIFQGQYIFYDESYLEGEFYFVFDFLKDGLWHRNCRTKTQYFKENKERYYRLVEDLNKKSS